MADIRINALANTASSTASDDYLAVDGTTNGTRKLSAYSPTFGGNLTVSGTGDSSVAGKLGIGTTSPARKLSVVASGTGNVATFESNAGPNIEFKGTESSGRTYLVGEGLVTAGNFSIYDSTGSAERLVVTSGGNVLVGATIDGGQKLQVSGTAIVAPNAGVANAFFVKNTAANGYSTIQFENSSGVGKGFIGYANSSVGNALADNFYILSIGSLILNTNNSLTPTLTLDTSSNATFAGDATWNKNGNITVTLATASTSSGATNRIRLATPTSTSDSRCGVIEFYKNGNTFNGDLRFNVAGGIALRNSADTVTFETDDNKNFVLNSGAIATNATNGFIYVATCTGTPTGTPTSYTGRAPIVVDTTNNKLYFYSGGAWRDAGP